MRQMRSALKLAIGGAAAIAMAGMSLTVWAQTAPTTTTSLTTSTLRVTKPKPTTATDQMVQEACQRQKARTAKALASGVPETFGSEEPFVFDPKAPRC
jgi:hypothetical protein